MAPLPDTRLQINTNCFRSTGVHYFGPMYVKRSRRTKEKRWVSLFTYMMTRAIHLELLNSLDTDAFIMALRRFGARRGACVSLTCDNGTK